MPEKTIKLESIRIDGGTQLREAVNTDAVSEYADAMKAGATFPPLEVVYDGVDHWLIGGFHRYHAMRTNGEASAECLMRSGTKAEAQWLACSENTDHGLPRTNADKRKAVKFALELKPGLSNKAVAEHCKVSDMLVAEVRRQVQVLAPDTAPSRTGRDGKQYPAPPRQPPPPKADASPPPKKQTSTAPPKQRKDPNGRAVDAAVAAALDAAHRFRELVNDTHALKRAVLALAGEGVGRELRAQQIERHFGAIVAAIEFGIPYCACPYAPNCLANCKTCAKTGWTTKEIYDRLPAEVK